MFYFYCEFKSLSWLIQVIWWQKYLKPERKKKLSELISVGSILLSSEGGSDLGRFLMTECNLRRLQDPSGDIITPFAFPWLPWEELISWTNRNTIITASHRPNQDELQSEMVLVHWYQLQTLIHPLSDEMHHRIRSRMMGFHVSSSWACHNMHICISTAKGTAGVLKATNHQSSRKTWCLMWWLMFPLSHDALAAVYLFLQTLLQRRSVSTFNFQDSVVTSVNNLCLHTNKSGALGPYFDNLWHIPAQCKFNWGVSKSTLLLRQRIIWAQSEAYSLITLGYK